mmetsp:Transcript_81249/g.148338  ORF Transcript_81249/g.148338 Transcript_81249/m.148338 type:complete len:202 (+) Transcript_81249:551-1156(+)
MHRSAATHQLARDTAAGHFSDRAPSENGGAASKALSLSACASVTLDMLTAFNLARRPWSMRRFKRAAFASGPSTNTATASSTWLTTAGGLRKERSSAMSRMLMAVAAMDSSSLPCDVGAAGPPERSAALSAAGRCRPRELTEFWRLGALRDGLRSGTEPSFLTSPVPCPPEFPGRARTRGCSGLTCPSSMKARSMSSAAFS